MIVLVRGDQFASSGPDVLVEVDCRLAWVKRHVSAASWQLLRTTSKAMASGRTIAFASEADHGHVEQVIQDLRRCSAKNSHVYGSRSQFHSFIDRSL